MPRGDGTGPPGQGPRLRRALGYCATPPACGCPYLPDTGQPLPDVEAELGGGRGYRDRFYPDGIRSDGHLPGPHPIGRTEEIDLLRSEAAHMRSVLYTIEQRLKELETL